MPASHWLVKTEPESYSWDELVVEGRTPWDGVRNHQARNNLQAMAAGDLVLVYHSGRRREVVGVAKVVRAAYPDPTAEDPRWVAVDLEPIRPVEEPVSLATLREEKRLADIALLRNSRLSVMPLPEAAFTRILTLGKTRL